MMVKFIFGVVITILITLIASIPEWVMFWAYHIIKPETDVTRVLTLAVFWICGGSLAIFFGFGGFMVWVAFMQALLESNL
jgi:hypothetical protein